MLLKGYIIFLLGLIFWEDLRHRAIHWSLLLQLAICVALQSILLVSKKAFITDSLLNLGFVTIQLAGVSLYFSLRDGRCVNILKDHIGPGDLLFLACCALAFSRINFPIFLLSGLLFSIVAYGFLLLIRRDTQRTVPTAGFLALYLAAWMSMEMLGAIGSLHGSLLVTARI